MGFSTPRSLNLLNSSKDLDGLWGPRLRLRPLGVRLQASWVLLGSQSLGFDPKAGPKLRFLTYSPYLLRRNWRISFNSGVHIRTI